MIALELEQAAVRVGGRTVVDGASFTVAVGEVVGLVGANGSGKTTLARAALGLLPLSAGRARLFGADPRRLAPSRRADLAALLPQERGVGWNLPAWRIAALGAPLAPAAVARERALASLEEVGAAYLARRGALELSGGERARVLLARLLATRAPLIVADEPEAGLDPAGQRLALERLREAARTGPRAVLAILHDLALAAAFCDRIAVMAEGRIVALGPPPEALAPSTLEAAFGLHGRLLETDSGPALAARRAQKEGAPGSRPINP